MDAKLKEIDKEYVISFSGIENHPLVLFAMSKIMELSTEEQNRVAMYLLNIIGCINFFVLFNGELSMNGLILKENIIWE